MGTDLPRAPNGVGAQRRWRRVVVVIIRAASCRVIRARDMRADGQSRPARQGMSTSSDDDAGTATDDVETLRGRLVPGASPRLAGERPPGFGTGRGRHRQPGTGREWLALDGDAVRLDRHAPPRPRDVVAMARTAQAVLPTPARGTPVRTRTSPERSHQAVRSVPPHRAVGRSFEPAPAPHSARRTVGRDALLTSPSCTRSCRRPDTRRAMGAVSRNGRHLACRR